MTIRIVQVGIADPRKGHAQLDALEAEGFVHESTILGRDGTAAIVTMRQGPQTVRDSMIASARMSLAQKPQDFVRIVRWVRDRGTDGLAWEPGGIGFREMDAIMACMEFIVGDGLDMRIVDPRAVVEAPKVAETLPAPPFVLNTDQRARREAIAARGEYMSYGDDDAWFKTTARGLRALIDGMFVTGDEAHAGDGSINTPTLREFLRFGERFPTTVFTGTAKPPANGQSNVVIDGVSLDLEPMPYGSLPRYQAAQSFSQFKNAGASLVDDTGLVLTAKWGGE